MQDANWTEQLVAVTVGVFYFTQKGKKCKHLNLKKKMKRISISERYHLHIQSTYK